MCQLWPGDAVKAWLNDLVEQAASSQNMATALSGQTLEGVGGEPKQI